MTVVFHSFPPSVHRIAEITLTFATVATFSYHIYGVISVTRPDFQQRVN